MGATGIFVEAVTRFDTVAFVVDGVVSRTVIQFCLLVI